MAVDKDINYNNLLYIIQNILAFRLIHKNELFKNITVYVNKEIVPFVLLYSIVLFCTIYNINKTKEIDLKKLMR